MTDRNIELSRRKILGAAGAIGIAGAGAGMGTSALFSDEESFTNNSIEAGTLDLIVDYYTSRDQGSFGSNSQSGEVNGDGVTEYTYDVVDLKPGDSGTLAFCPKVVDNPGWLWVGSVEGVTDYENGQTEPEEDVDATGDGSLSNSTNDGAGAGELSDEIEVTVSYAESVSYDSDEDEITCNNTRELVNPSGYTLADLAKDLESGFPLDGDQPGGDDNINAYPSSSDGDDQQGPCLCIEWEVPAEVGNEIQSDALELSFQFAAEQERNNPDPDNPFVDLTVGTDSGFDYNSIQAAVDAASVGEVISVAPGSYTEGSGTSTVDDDEVTIDTDDVLLASTAGAESTTFNGRMVITGDGVTLCGFKVSPPPSTGNLGSDEAIRVSNSPDGVTVRGNIVEGFSRGDTSGFYGIDGINVFGGSSGDPIENVTIANNEVRDLQNSVSGGAAGISIQGNVDSASVRGNTISQIGKGVTSYGFGVVVRGTGNHGKVPKNVNVVSNHISDVLADTSTSALGVGLEVEAGGPNLLFADNTVKNVNIGVELKAAATETTLVGNDIGPIDTSVNAAQFSSVPALYLGDQTGNAPIGTFIADNSYDVVVKSDGPFGSYVQAIVPQ